MVFGLQRSSGRATAPQSRLGSVLVRASTISCKTAVDAGRPPMVHPMSAPIYPAGAQPSLPPPIAEDGCEVVPQFFPGYHNSVPQSPAARFAPSRHSTSHAISQRRAGSVKLPASPGSDGGPRRYSNGSSVSSTSTMTMHSQQQQQQQLSYQAPCYYDEAHAPPAKSGTDAHKTPVAYYHSAQAFPPTPTPPPMPSSAQHHTHGYTTPDNHRLSLASSSGHSANRHSVASLPPRSRRPASILVSHVNSPLSPAASPRYSQAMPSELPAAVQSDELPGSYAYRRRGSSFLDNSGTVSSSNSSIASPALPATPKEYNWPASAMPHSQMYSGHAPGHLAYGQHQHQHQSTLCRNNTTKTVSYNDLAADHHGNNYHAAAAAGSSAGYVRHLSPSRSATFAASASSPREYQRRAYGYQSPARDNSICTLVEHGNAAVNEITATQRKSERPGDVCDDVDVDVPNVCTIGKQFAYLPPRTANFSITN